MRFLKLTLAYDGTRYVGWQVQPNGISVQQRLEEAWKAVTGEARRITASGRTDSGVHAEGQICSVRTVSKLDVHVLARALNANLPDDIAVVYCHEMSEDFHAIRDAIEKTYRYQIQSGPIRDVHGRHFWWYVPPSIDVGAMATAADYLIGEHDFASFQTTGSERKSTVRTITNLSVDSHDDQGYQRVCIEVTANGFLYNMVRCIAGTLAVVGKGREAPDWVRNVLNARCRSNAGPTAPPQGLFLQHVKYAAKFMPEST
ncbi:MAG: tRNA pseudouridine(38-40) synthase TruA [Pirellulaceae bacterium]